MSHAGRVFFFAAGWVCVLTLAGAPSLLLWIALGLLVSSLALVFVGQFND
jgi:hypothetical protein